MNTAIKHIATGLALCGLALPLVGQTLISHDFGGSGSADLDGVAADLYDSSAAELSSAAGADQWQANSIYKANGDVNPGAPTSTTQGGAYLPFVPQVGKIYEITATFTFNPNGADNEFIGFGFSRDNDINDNLQDSLDGFSWIVQRGINGSPGRYFHGAGAFGGDNFTVTRNTPQTFSVLLNATDPDSTKWSGEGYLNGTLVGSFATPANGNPGFIDYVALTKNVGDVSGNFDSFEVSIIPEPSATGLIFGGLTGLLLLRRRRARR